MSRSALILLVMAVCGLAGCWEEEEKETQAEPRPVLAIEVGKTDYIGQRSFPGRARAAREVSLAFRVGGAMSQRKVNVGDVVQEGDVIAVLDPQPFQAAVAQLEADLEAAKADFMAKNEQYGPVERLVANGPYSEARGDASRAERDTASARVSSIGSALERAELDLSYTLLKAPYSGRVVSVFSEDFEEVAAQKPIIRLLDSSSVEIVIDVPETQITLVPLVEELTVVFDAFPDMELIGTISEVGSEASQTTRTYPVTIVIQQTEGATILPGMSGRARASKVADPNLTSGFVVPAGAVRPLKSGGDEMAVWVIDEASQTVSLTPVEVGQLLSVGIEVTNGLSVGDWVVTAGTHSLREEQEVTILPAGSGDAR